MMHQERRICRAELGQHADEIAQAGRQGEAVLIEDDGRVVAAIVDIVEYRLMRALARQRSQPRPAEIDAGPSDDQVAHLADDQARYDLVLTAYLAGAITLARAAELLGLFWLELRQRFERLGIPVRSAPADGRELAADVAAAEARLAAGQ